MTCVAPATCDRSGSRPRCECPSGYDDVEGDGSNCEDIDECSDSDLNDCDAHASCENSDGEYSCECNGPAYEGDGQECACADGYVDASGECLAEDGSECEDDDGCENGHCVSGVCCASACDEPPQCTVAEGATCEDGSTCEYAADDDGIECDDDNICTESDICEEGECVGDGSEVPTTTSCGDPDACTSEGYTCAGNARGDCLPINPIDCSGEGDACNEPVCDPVDGCAAMPVEDGTACDDGDGCTEGDACSAGVCEDGEPKDCDDENPCTDDSCNVTVGCMNAANAAACDDANPCTSGDHCAGGACATTGTLDCSSQDDPCNLGVCDPTDGSCDKSPRTNGTGCSAGDSCSGPDTCTDGTCTPGGNACGQYATGCTAGTPNACVCQDMYIDNGAGTCVPNTNECLANPCGVGAPCHDPSAAPNNVICPCNGNPCGDGRGTCGAGPTPGTHSCTCIAGYTQVGPTCGCALTGTFALRIQTPVTWPTVNEAGFDVVESGSDVIESWALRRQQYGANGMLRTETIGCGGTTADLCGLAPFFGNEAYAQYTPNHVWGTPSMPVEVSTFSLPNAWPGQPFVTPDTAALLGISLTNPLGPWPASRANVGVGPMQTNGAVWRDDDGDTLSAVTTLAVPPGGITDDNAGNNDPPFNFGATSPRCLRTTPATETVPYVLWPAAEGFEIRRINRFYVASRTISHLDGNLMTCDRILGDVEGPDAGGTRMHIDGRFSGCADDSLDTVCGGAVVDLLDTQEQNQMVTGGTFVIERVADNYTCDQVRAHNYAP